MTISPLSADLRSSTMTKSPSRICDSMIDEQIRDGDFVIVEDRKAADNGETVIALAGGLDVTLKKFYRENGRVRLQPANPTMQPIMVDPDQVQVQGVVVGVMRKY